MKSLKLTFVNVGYGEAILLECPDPKFADGVFVMLIDGGTAEAAEFTDTSSGRLPLADYLQANGPGHIDLMVSTHIHEDHLCGLLPAANLMMPSTLWQTLPSAFASRMHSLDVTLSKNASQDKFIRALNDYRDLCRAITADGGDVHMLRAGDSGCLCENLTYRVLAPSAVKAAELERGCLELYEQQDERTFLQKLDALDARMNNYSLVLLLEYRGTRLLLPGDTNCLGYGDVAPTDLNAHLFKVGHHGQKDGVTQELLDAIGPKAVVCCASSDRRYNSAHPDVLNLFQQAGADCYFSDCPKLPGLDLSPHSAVSFAVGAGGALSAQYVI